MASAEIVRRPGGRSARVRDSVLEAALGLLDEGRSQMTIPDIAARAGVAPSSVYRRWGSWESVVTDALLEHSAVAMPVPDLGSLRDDLVEFCTLLAIYLATPRGSGLVRAIASAERTEAFDAARARFWDERFAVAQVMFDRAVARGELSAGVDRRLLLEMAIAPLHLRHMLLGQEATSCIEAQVDLLLHGSRSLS